MKFSIRLLHFALGLIVSLNLLIVCITGLILGVHINSINQLEIPTVDSNSELAGLLSTFSSNYPSIYNISIDENRRVHGTVETDNGAILEGFFDPKNARYVGAIPKEPRWVKLATTVHRSILLGNAGRIIVFFTSILTILVSVSGIFVWFRKYRSLSGLRKTLFNESLTKTIHSHGGLLSVFPLLTLAVTASFLSWNSIINNGIRTEQNYESDLPELPGIEDGLNVEFPLFPEEGEPYIISNADGRWLAQKSPDLEVIGFTPTTIWQKTLSTSLALHTGIGSSPWLYMLALSTLLTLYFIYSGIRISWWRFRVDSKPTKRTSHVILYASQGGTTKQLAYCFKKQLKGIQIKSKVKSINSFRYSDKIEYVWIFAATYGQGEAPENGDDYINALGSIPDGTMKYSVLGFGSEYYPNFCKFAKDVDVYLQERSHECVLSLQTVNQKSKADYTSFVESAMAFLGHSSPEKLFWLEN